MRSVDSSLAGSSNLGSMRAVGFSVDRLPESQRAVILLRDVDALDLKDIAELLDVGLSSVKVRLHRARHALRRALSLRLTQPDR